jgi:hypothetical protein
MRMPDRFRTRAGHGGRGLLDGAPRWGRFCALSFVALLALAQSACLLPVRSAPGFEGRVVDQASGEPVEGALVVVRFDGRYGDQLPDREHLGHAETRTGPDGRFELARYTRGGLTFWPMFETEARVVAVLGEGYRCATPIHVRSDREVQIQLTPALDDQDRRQSCRPVASRRGEAESYRIAWQELFPAPETPADRENKRQVARLLRARATMGFGENCQGPVSDLTLAPGGQRTAFIASGQAGPQIQLVELGHEGPGAPKIASELGADGGQRLAWNAAGELVLFRPASRAQRMYSASVFAPGRSEVVWSTTPSLPASIDRNAPLSRPREDPQRPLEPADLSDEAQTLWLGRSFAIEQEVDPGTGLSADRLVVTRENGGRYEIALPGEACGEPRYGRPQYRIGAGGRMGIDLRFVDGGCHAVAIDLESGHISRLDRSAEPATCRAQRSIPPAQLQTALRGWSRELDAALASAGADNGASYAIRIAKDGTTRVQARDYAGATVEIAAAPFPITTPLRRIDVTHVAPHQGGDRAFPGTAPADLEPL